MLHWLRTKFGSASRGQSTVELALGLVILLLLVCGTADLGRVFYYGVTITQAAREGARALATNSDGSGPGAAAGCSAVKDAVTNIANPSSQVSCQSGSTTPAQGSVSVVITCADQNQCLSDPVGASPGQTVTVDVYYSFQLLPFGSFAVFQTPIVMHEQAVMEASW
jgi:Flp pilus assembly protein TadG